MIVDSSVVFWITTAGRHAGQGGSILYYYFIFPSVGQRRKTKLFRLPFGIFLQFLSKRCVSHIDNTEWCATKSWFSNKAEETDSLAKHMEIRFVGFRAFDGSRSDAANLYLSQILVLVQFPTISNNTLLIRRQDKRHSIGMRRETSVLHTKTQHKKGNNKQLEIRILVCIVSPVQYRAAPFSDVLWKLPAFMNRSIKLRTKTKTRF